MKNSLWLHRLFRSVQLLSRVRLFATRGTAARQASLSITNSQSLLKLMSTESVMSSNCLILSPPSPPALNLSQDQSFPMSWPFASGGQMITASASVLQVNIQGWLPLGLTGLISLLSKRLKSLLHHHSLQVSILQCSAFFMVQLSYPYLTTGKTITLTIQTFVSKLVAAF